MFSSQISGAVEFMNSEENPPLLIENEKNKNKKVLISWNIKGDAAKDVRLHDEPFYGTENRGIIDVVNHNINIEFVKVYLKENIISMGKFNRANEAHVGKVRRLSIKVPINNDGSFDINKQKQIVEAYNEIIEFKERMQEKIELMIDSINNINVMK